MRFLYPLRASMASSRVKLTARKISIQEIESTLKCARAIQPHESWMDLLIRNKMASPHETTHQMWERVAAAISLAGKTYHEPDEITQHKKDFHTMLSQVQFIASTPIYTNLGRHQSKSLSACAVPPVDFRSMSFEALRSIVSHYHVKGMGTGFNFDDAEDPVAMLRYLNQCAVDEVSQGLIERPVGNMGILSVDHPRVYDFMRVKRDPSITDWKFNISINLNDAFMQALKNNAPYTTPAGRVINPTDLMHELAECCRVTGDPGIVFMDRYEQSNKTPQLGQYVSLAPCGEVPLFRGEVCQFGYINLYAFILNDDIDYEALRQVVHRAVLFLDNALEYSMMRLDVDESVKLVSSIRKIGVGLCGFADTLQALGLPYDSAQAITLAENVMSFMNYESKKASVELAKQRGAFPAFHDLRTNRSRIVGGFLGQSTDTVSAQDWADLSAEIETHGIRHVSTSILPPTGRSAYTHGVSTSIEPHFRLYADDKLLRSVYKQIDRLGLDKSIIDSIKDSIAKTGSMPLTGLPPTFRAIYQTCLELSPEAHLNMVSTFQKFTDESISKTVNVPATMRTDAMVKDIFIKAYDDMLKGISVYVDGSRQLQPKPLQAANSNLLERPKLSGISVDEPSIETYRK
jgi:ribonucleoside-diphosphate reductase alpha chain